MTKHQLIEEIATGLGLQFSPGYVSTGSTVTAIGLSEILVKLLNLQKNSNLKHDLIKQICAIQNIQVDPAWFSSGSTVTKDSLQAIYDDLKSKNII